MLSGFNSISLPVSQLSLAAVLKCGQSFRWHEIPLNNESWKHYTPSIEYRLALRDRVICLRQSTDTLFYRALYPKHPTSQLPCDRDSETLNWLQDYFQLDVDLVNLYNDWSSRDAVFSKFRSRFEGIRILRQDPWENLISFICSSNNNISRISKMVQNLCIHFSPPLELNEESSGSRFHCFPPPSSLATPEVSAKLRSLGFGYRAEFIQRTAQMLIDIHGDDEHATNFLHTLRSKSTDDSREELLKFIGVGRKVADCVLLMSLDKREVVPVDTHVHQIAMKYYNLRGSPSKQKQAMNAKLYEEVQCKLAKVWGPWAGWAHTVLFTADLKAFESYGNFDSTLAIIEARVTQLPTPLPSPQRQDKKTSPRGSHTISPPSKKRRRREVVLDKISQISEDTTIEGVKSGARDYMISIPETIQEEVKEEGSLHDRVKRRRRAR